MTMYSGVQCSPLVPTMMRAECSEKSINQLSFAQRLAVRCAVLFANVRTHSIVVKGSILLWLVPFFSVDFKPVGIICLPFAKFNLDIAVL